MSSRTAGLLVLSTASVVLGMSALASGCSDDATPAATNSADAEAAADAPQRDAPPAGEAGPEQTRATCVADCAAQHPSGKTKDDAIAMCWDTKCAGRCTGEGLDGSDVDAGDVDSGACQNPVTTGLTDCDLCTRTNCCAAWDGCFNDDDCASFVACTSDCPAE